MTLYTKIRPKTFDEVKGQEFTVNNLRMQSIRDKFFQVIILAGQYGAGKTTLARIVATAANCKNKDKNGNPCGTCDGCRSVSSGSVDFLEIDGASNTGVDHVRDLTDWLHERPLGKRKIVIIDEVHMLSRQAFNALFKNTGGTTSLCTDHSLHNRSRPDPGNHPVAICLLYHHADPRGHHL